MISDARAARAESVSRQRDDEERRKSEAARRDAAAARDVDRFRSALLHCRADHPVPDDPAPASLPPDGGAPGEAATTGLPGAPYRQPAGVTPNGLPPGPAGWDARASATAPSGGVVGHDAAPERQWDAHASGTAVSGSASESESRPASATESEPEPEPEPESESESESASGRGGRPSAGMPASRAGMPGGVARARARLDAGAHDGDTDTGTDADADSRDSGAGAEGPAAAGLAREPGAPVPAMPQPVPPGIFGLFGSPEPAAAPAPPSSRLASLAAVAEQVLVACNGTREVRVQVRPEIMPGVSFRVAQEGGTWRVQFDVSDPASLGLLQDSGDRLAAELATRLGQDVTVRVAPAGQVYRVLPQSRHFARPSQRADDEEAPR